MNARRYLNFLIVSAFLSLTLTSFEATAQQGCIDVSGKWVNYAGCGLNMDDPLVASSGIESIFWGSDLDTLLVKQQGCDITSLQSNIDNYGAVGPVYTGTIDNANVLNLSGLLYVKAPYLWPVDVSFSTNSSTITGIITIEPNPYPNPTSPIFKNSTYRSMKLVINGRAVGQFSSLTESFDISASNVTCYLAAEDSHNPTVKIRVDANRDGTVSFDDTADATSPDNPYRFWINNDSDTTSAFDNGQDIFSPQDPQWITDSSKNVPSHYRDLEDFAQLQIRTNPDATNLILNNGYYLTLEVNGVSIKLFGVEHAGKDYITHASTAKDFLATMTLHGSSDQKKFTPYLYTPSAKDTSVTSNFLFEGVNPGKGTIKVSLRDPSGVEAASDQLDVELSDVQGMFDPQVASKDETKTVIVFVHGCCVDDGYWRMESNAAFKRLWWNGYKGRFASFRWVTIPGFPPTQFNQQEFNAWHSAPLFRDYVMNKRNTDWNGYKVYVLAHSQGNVVVTEALNLGLLIDKYVLTQAAVPADCYDRNTSLYLPVWDLLDRLNPAPYEDPMGYAGHCSRISVTDGVIANFFNPSDGALASWVINNLRKPDSINNYFFRNGVPVRRISGGRNPQYVTITDPYESKAFVARSRTRPIGSEGRTRGPITQWLNLNKAFGFGSTAPEHAAQFERAIQNTYGYYDPLLKTFGLK